MRHSYILTERGVKVELNIVTWSVNGNLGVTYMYMLETHLLLWRSRALGNSYIVYIEHLLYCTCVYQVLKKAGAYYSQHTATCPLWTLLEVKRSVIGIFESILTWSGDLCLKPPPPPPHFLPFPCTPTPFHLLLLFLVFLPAAAFASCRSSFPFLVSQVCFSLVWREKWGHSLVAPSLTQWAQWWTGNIT